MQKACTKCKENKELSEFNKNKGGKFGLNSRCKICFHEINKIWAKKNHTHRMEQQKIRLLNPLVKQKHLDAFTQWRLKNLEYDSYRAATRRADKQKQTPIWADLNQIKQVYLNCPGGYHVDHIVPLKGKNVSGLHVEYNLQYLSAIENMSKGNRYASWT